MVAASGYVAAVCRHHGAGGQSIPRSTRPGVARTGQNSYSYSIALDGIAKLANDHVLQMQAWSESYLSNPLSYPRLC